MFSQILYLISSFFVQILALPLPGIENLTYGGFFSFVWFYMFIGWFVYRIIGGELNGASKP